MASPKTTNPNKRACSARSPAQLALDDENDEEFQTLEHWPRFLVIESAEEGRTLSCLSPFAIEKAMKGLAGEVKSVKKLRSGLILVEVLRAAQANNLLKQTMFGSIQVKVSAHRSLNSSKGVINDRDLAQLDSEELVNELKLSGVPVTHARNIYQKRNGQQRKTATIVLTFALPNVPDKIKAGYSILKVQPFIPNPLRCFKCQAFGHHQSTCKKEELCPKCGLAAHGLAECEAPVKCVNCGGDHPVFASSCPKWKLEKEICRVKTLNNISFPEARRQVTGDAPSSNRTLYSNIVRSVKSVSVATQTEVINCTCQPQNIVEPSRQTKKDHVKFRTYTDG